MTEQILNTVRSWILKNGNPQDANQAIHITKLEYKASNEIIDIDLIWIRSKGKYDRVEFTYNEKLIKADIEWK